MSSVFYVFQNDVKAMTSLPISHLHFECRLRARSSACHLLMYLHASIATSVKHNRLIPFSIVISVQTVCFGMNDNIYLLFK